MAGGRRGPAPQTVKREQFARLIAEGVSSSEACRIVGLNRRTGKRWRHGRTITVRDGRKLHYPPVISARKREISSRYLSEDERVRIADLRRQRLGVRAIAEELGRHPSTISRELRRNVEEPGGAYRPFAAERLAAARRRRTRAGRLVADPVLGAFVAARLKLRWSPEQISAAARRAFPDDRSRHVVPETIYQAVYRPARAQRLRELPVQPTQVRPVDRLVDRLGHHMPAAVIGKRSARSRADLLRAPPQLQPSGYERPQHRVSDKSSRSGPTPPSRRQPLSSKRPVRPARLLHVAAAEAWGA